MGILDHMEWIDGVLIDMYGFLDSCNGTTGISFWQGREEEVLYDRQGNLMGDYEGM